MLCQKKKTQRRNKVIILEIRFIAKGQQIRFILVSELCYAWSEISEAEHSKSCSFKIADIANIEILEWVILSKNPKYWYIDHIFFSIYTLELHK